MTISEGFFTFSKVSQPTPGTPSLLRAINDRAALRVLLDRGPLTRPELGALTRLAKPTASQLLLRLQEAGLVVLDGIREGLPGRTAELYRINAGAAHVAALDVTRDRIEVAVADLAGSVVGTSVLPTPGRTQGDVVDKVRTALAEAWPHAVNRVVIGIQGAVDPGTGRLGYAAHIPGWHIPDLVQTLSEGVGTPVDVENDVNLSRWPNAPTGGTGDFDPAAGGLGHRLGDRARRPLHRGATGGAGRGRLHAVPSARRPRGRRGQAVDHGFQAGRRRPGGAPAAAGARHPWNVRGRRPWNAPFEAADGGSARRGGRRGAAGDRPAAGHGAGLDHRRARP